MEELIYDPQQLERLLVERENAGDVDGMTALFEPEAVIELNGTERRGARPGSGGDPRVFTALQLTGLGPEGRRFGLGEQRPALISGNLALT